MKERKEERMKMESEATAENGKNRFSSWSILWNTLDAKISTREFQEFYVFKGGEGGSAWM